jgi:hypothetical protein
MLVLMGTTPGTDVLAHVGGFVCGVLLGGILNILPARVGFRQKVDQLCLLFLPTWVIFTWWRALNDPC